LRATIENEEDRAIVVHPQQEGEHMLRSNGRRLGLMGALMVALALALAGPAFAAPDHQTVDIYDDCEPASFNAAIGPGTCVGDGDTTFGAFVGELAARIEAGGIGSIFAWRFEPRQVKLELGGTVTADNEGGEFHTFTEVRRYGNACVPPLNTPAGAPPSAGVDCSLLATTGVVPGGDRVVSGLSEGKHRFECLIHPWMRSTVTVERRHHGDDDDDHHDD
jgi:plastocyanin